MEAATGIQFGWAESQWRRRIIDVQRLRGGWTSTMLRLTGDDGAQAVLRLMTKDPWRRHAAGLLSREAAVQQQLVRSVIPAPRSIAVDLHGDHAGAPAHLMSWVPGRLCLDSATDQILETLAQTLVDVHRFEPAREARPREYQSWAPPSKRIVPAWAQRPTLWSRAFSLLDQPEPGYTGTFLHRDFHLGNVLWSHMRVTAVVDWVETSWGPAGLDVAHTANNLAMLHGTEAATRFTSAYHRLTGDPRGEEDHRYWNVMDIVGYLPDPVKVAQPWREHGREISDDLARSRLEERLAQFV